jgi:hypothetical protein
VKSLTLAVTVARAATAYEIESESAIPSPSGEITGGATVRPETTGTEDTGDAGGATGTVLPMVPVAGRVAGPASIVHVYRPAGAAAESHVHETVEPVPLPRATVAPAALCTVTVHAPGAESLAVKRTAPPRAPVAAGA